MAVYLIINVDVKDPVAYEQYKNEAPRITRKHGGEYLARGGKFRIIEGDWKPGRIVLIRFPDEKSVDEFYNDPEYQPLKHLRHKVSNTDIVLVEGIEA